MIVEWLIKAGQLIFDAIFAVLGILPKFSPDVTNTVDTIFNFMFDNGVGIVGIFVDINFIKIMIPVVIATLNFDNIYTLVMWILKKIPILDIK